MSYNCKKRRTGSMNEIESDNETNKSPEKEINTAVKLLMIKYSFEKGRKLTKIRRKDNTDNMPLEDKDKDKENPVTMKDKMKQYGNLKPKRRFIMMQDKNSEEEKQNKPEQENNTENSDKGSNTKTIIVDELSAETLSADKAKDENTDALNDK